MTGENIRIEGLKELEKALREIAPQIKGNPLRNAARAMTVPLIDAMKQNAGRIDNPKTRTSIQNVIDKRLIPTRERDAATAKGDSLEIFEVGPRKKKSAKGPGAWYVHFVEFGTVKQSAQPFMRPAFNSTKQKSIDEFVDHLSKSLARAAKRLAKK